MKAIILAGGYGKRLWPISRHIPKPLIDIGRRPLLDHIIDKIKAVRGIDKIYISTNERFAFPMTSWMQDHQNGIMELIIEPTKEEEGKFGTIAGLEYIIKSKHIDDDCLIIAGDNLFDFDIDTFINYFKEKKSSVIAVYDIGDITKAIIYGIVSVDKSSRITDFVEKSPEPKSTLAATCCYIIKKDSVRKIAEYVAGGGRKDSPGFFISWLSKKEPVYAFSFRGHWFDIGDFESLEKAREFMKSRRL